MTGSPFLALRPNLTRRLSEADKSRLTMDGRSVWATVDRKCKARANVFRSFFEFLWENSGKGCVKIIASATSYYALIYDTQQHQDRSLEKLQKKTFECNSTEIPTSYAKFGDVGENGPHAWVVAVGPTHTAVDIQAGLNKKFKERGPVIPAYVIREVLAGKISTATFVIIFPTPTQSLGRSINVGPTQDRCNIKKEGARCALCNRKGHQC
ncbi:hypothetical protein VTN96DRAFT_608 [Rasamsonia emersonii]